MEENNRKGPGIFYAVVGVATLVVAIIGATFAFFSATAEDDTITGTTAKGEVLTLSVDRVTDEATVANMIPMYENDIAKGLVGGKRKEGEGTQTSCIDSNGYTVCQVYSITITNTGSIPVDVVGTLTLDGAAATNIKWKLIENATTEGTVGTAVDNKEAGFIVESLELTEAEKDGQPLTTNTKTYYIVIWLEETGDIQDTEANQTYTGKVTFESLAADGSVSSGLTASFTA